MHCTLVMMSLSEQCACVKQLGWVVFLCIFFFIFKSDNFDYMITHCYQIEKALHVPSTPNEYIHPCNELTAIMALDEANYSTKGNLNSIF